jgi:uncharacterized protein YunC (DUF1805 family)
MDSITKVTADDEGSIVVSASHGGASSGEVALAIPLACVFFNDAGVGKDNAGIVALDLLDRYSIPAGTVAHTTARIGDAQDMWESGIISHLNRAAMQLGITPGRDLRTALNEVIGSEQ